jgi:WASH complex subunit 7
VFIEITKETKQIKTISVNQMLYSIKTHGVGILGTAVNTIYKYLIKRFSHFSDFLYDDIIHSNLLREQRLFNKNKEKLNGQYPYERAEKLSKDIKKLGTLGKKNLTYLDTFRQLISTIGNALGIVRMIRNASLKDNSNLIRFIPKIIEELKFEDVAEELGLKGETFEACKMFDISVRLLFKQEEDATDFLRILVKNFEGAFDGADCAHLKLFHLILPSLTLNFIEHVMRGKDKIFKRNNKEAFISDDGFALGSSYLLKILDQNEAFKSLNWFQHMNEKFERDT